MTEQDLTRKILRNANQQAKELVATAEQHAAEQISAAKAQAEARYNIALEKNQSNLAYRKEQQQRAHEVEQIKAHINAQQDWVDRAFKQARENLIHASDAEIKTIVDTYVKKYAKHGDKILVAKNWAHALPTYPTTDTIQGGIIIDNETYRIELDIDSILTELREPLASTVAEMLGVL